MIDPMLLFVGVVPTTTRQRSNNESIYEVITNVVAIASTILYGCPNIGLEYLKGKIATEVAKCIRAFLEQQDVEIVELNVQNDHEHLLVMVPPKVSISNYGGTDAAFNG